jgi:hypothetical protein
VKSKPLPMSCRSSEYADAGLTHFVIRFTGDHERQLEAVAGIPLGCVGNRTRPTSLVKD